MTLEEAIEHCKEKACGNNTCNFQHKQLAQWLIELKDYKEQKAAKSDKPVAVDLGLPSGLKWADRNVGARSPEDCGLYFSWGNVEGVEHGKVCNFSEDAYRGTEGSYIDNADIDPDGGLDAARENLGAPWRMPRVDDFEELCEHCTHKWTEQCGYYGMKFTSKTNGNSIFFPASGFGVGSSWNYRGMNGNYWSGSFYAAHSAQCLRFVSSGVRPKSTNLRYFGFSVRPVRPFQD